MTTVIDSEWIAVKDDEVGCRAYFREELERELRKQGKDPDDYDLLRVPKAASSMII